MQGKCRRKSRVRVYARVFGEANTVRVSTFGITDRGRKRPTNEDDLAIVDLETGRAVERHRLADFEVGHAGILLAVCDGVGGHRAGEVASALALSRLIAE